MIEKLQEIKKMDLNCGVFSVYDMDGKTTQEIFNQFFTKINDVIDATNASVTLIEYLVSVGLQEEIAKKLVQWLEDGTLDTIVNEEVLEEINNKVTTALEEVQGQKDKIDAMVYKIEEHFDFIQEKEGYNVKYYGANGDGVEDDTEAIKKALFAVQYEEHNKTVYLPSGVYIVSESLNIPKGVALVGDAKSIIKFNANHIKLNLDGSNILLKDITIDGNKGSVTTTNAITNMSTGLSNNVTMQNVVFTNFDGVELNLIELSKIKNLNINGCAFDNITGSQVKIINVHTGSKDVRIKDNTFTNCSGTSIDNYAINIEEDSKRAYVNAIIDGNMFHRIDVDACIRIYAQNVAVINNTFNIQDSLTDSNAILVDYGLDIKIKNNIYNIIGGFDILKPIVRINAGEEIMLESDAVFLDTSTAETIFTKKRPLYSLKSSAVTIKGANITGEYHSDSIIDATDMTSLKIIDCIVELHKGKTPTFLSIQGKTAVEMINNNINLYNGKSLVISSSESSTGKVKLLNNIFNPSMTSGITEKDCVRLRNFTSAIIENNKLSGNVTVEDFERLELNNNTLGRLHVKSNKYDITSQNNIFDGKYRACYELSCNSQEECKLFSKNNYNKSNYRLIIFYCTNGNFLNASNMDIKTIDDVNSDEVQAHKNEYIARDSNVTSDIFKQCFVKTTQEHPRFTWYSSDYPLIDYKKPNGTIIYNASTGKSSVYITHNGITKVTQL